MRIAVLGTGVVGQTLGSALIECGHEVWMGSRSASHDGATQWAMRTGGHHADFRAAADNADLVINATAGQFSLVALQAAGADALGSKVIVDVSNPLDFSNGFPPTLTVSNTTSLAEEIQSAFPHTKVVKTLNTVTAEVMVAPSALGDKHAVFLASDHDQARTPVLQLLSELGWKAGQVVDLGDLSGARGMEMYLPLWVRLYQSSGSAIFNVEIVRPQ